MNWTKNQLDAINKEGQNIIVSAGAGSGKTAVLSERVLRIIKSGVDIRNILILTFTNEAAGEMKERIRKKLKKNNLEEALEYIDVANITTFDAFALNLVKEYHDILNISDEITIIDSSIINLEKKRIIDEVFEYFYDKKDARFHKLIKDFTSRDDEMVKDAILKMNNTLDLKYNKKSYLDNFIDSFYDDSYIDKIIQEYFLYLKNIVDLIEEDFYTLESSLDEKNRNKLSEVIKPFLNPRNYEDIRSILKYNFPRLLGLEDEEKNIKESLKNNFNLLKKLCAYSISELKEQINSTKDYVSVIIDIILMLDEKIICYKKEKSAFEFIDIAKMAILIVEQDKDIQNKLKKKFHEIMIDEYQDTNDLQEYFISLIENNNVYMVGDVKQSIYRFRNANPNIFREKYEQYKKNNGGIAIDLVENFRSRKEVLESINSIFDLIMTNALGGISYKQGHEMVYGNKEYENSKTNSLNYEMEILTYSNSFKEYRNVEVEAFTIAKDIKEKMKLDYLVYDFDLKKTRKATYQDFCIILDRGNDIPTYKKIFEYFGIPLEAYQDSNLTSTYDFYLIKNLISMILCIYNKEFDMDFRYYFTSIARSYISTLDDPKILKILDENTIFDTEIYKKCENLAKNLENKTPSILLEELIDEFNLYESCIRVGNVLDFEIRINHLLNLAHDMEALGLAIDDFKNMLDNITTEELEIKYKEPKSSASCVKIMNIHKSKGLEFPICYFAGYKKDFNLQELKQKFMFDNIYGILTPFYNEGIGTLITKELIKNHYYEDEIAEKIRLFYVALTRAKEKIIIVTPELSNNYAKNEVNYLTEIKYRSFYDFLNSISFNLEKYTKMIDIESINLTHEYEYSLTKEIDIKKSTKKIDFIEHDIDSNLIESKHASKTIKKLLDLEENKALEFGTNIHHILELTDFKNNSNNPYIKNLQETFDFKTPNVYQEHEFIYDLDNTEYHGIIDLMLEYPDTIKIIDYKLKNIDDEAYVKQLEMYYDYIRSITNKKIELYLYSVIDNKVKEIKLNESVA